MRRILTPAPWIVAVLLALPPCAARAERATEAEARTAAENYVQLVLAKQGSWGGSQTARIKSVEPFSRGSRQLGWCCQADPSGFLILPLYKELAPIRAYSDRGSFDPASNEEMAGLLKERLERLYAAIERRLGHAPEPGDDLRAILPVNFRGAWGTLAGGTFDPLLYRGERRTRGAGMDYQEGDALLTSRWHQWPPYNDDCPVDTCSWPGYGSYNTNVVVGCVATAGAQLLRFWGWPPAGVDSIYADPYDYGNMCDKYTWDGGAQCFKTEHDVCANQQQIDAVAEINSEFGIAVLMGYSCGGSVSNMVNVRNAVMNHFRYGAGAEWLRAADYSYRDWFEILKEDFNQNRVVEYSGGAPSDHAIVLDGWREDLVPPDTLCMIHGVYGYANYWDETWFTLDEVLQSPHESEELVRRTYPDCALGTTIDGAWDLPAYPYRYFDRDANARSAIFASGTNFPVLRSGFRLSNTAPTPIGTIIFDGTPSSQTLFYLYGDPVGNSRIRIRDGRIKIRSGGQMAIY
jgi:hypothetical protein